MGYAYHPRTRLACPHGFAVGRVRGYVRVGRTANPCRHHRWPHGFVHNPSWIHEVAYAIQGEKLLPFVVPKIHSFDCLSGLPLHTQVFSQFL